MGTRGAGFPPCTATAKDGEHAPDKEEKMELAAEVCLRLQLLYNDDKRCRRSSIIRIVVQQYYTTQLRDGGHVLDGRS